MSFSTLRFPDFVLEITKFQNYFIIIFKFNFKLLRFKAIYIKRKVHAS